VRTRRKPKFDALDVINYTILSISGLLAIFPVWYIFVISVSTGQSYISDKLHFWPKAFSLAEYSRAILAGGITHSLGISAIVTVAGTIFSLLLSIPCAYALSKKRLRGRNIFLTLIIFTMFFNGGLIPNYLLVVKLGLKNNLLSLVLPLAVSTYYLLIIKTFMTTIPPSLEESAKIDGYNDFGILIKIVFPVSMPMIAAISLFYGVQYYNDYFNALLYISSRKLYPLQVLLREMVINNIANDSSVGGDSTLTGEIFKMACVILGIIPILVVYPFLQKYFVTGIMLGSVKE